MLTGIASKISWDEESKWHGLKLKDDKKKHNKSFDIFLCLNPRFRGQKWA